jgi:hypothetical protein
VTELERICKLVEERANAPVEETKVDPWVEEQERVQRRIAARRRAHPEESDQTVKWLSVLEDVTSDPEVVQQMQDAKAAREKASREQRDDLAGYIPGQSAPSVQVTTEPQPEPHTLADKLARGAPNRVPVPGMGYIENHQPQQVVSISNPLYPRWDVAKPSPSMDGYDDYGNLMPI